jgi:hypothetical protein
LIETTSTAKKPMGLSQQAQREFRGGTDAEVLDKVRKADTLFCSYKLKHQVLCRKFVPQIYASAAEKKLASIPLTLVFFYLPPQNRTKGKIIESGEVFPCTYPPVLFQSPQYFKN